MAPLCSVTTVSAETTNTNISIDKGEDVLKLAKKAGLEGTKIKMMLWWNAGKDDKAEAETFKEETGIEVSYETIAMSQYQTQLSSKVMAKNAPAMAAISNEWYPQPITRGLMQPIYNVRGWDWADDSIYATDLMEDFSYQGVPYGIALKGSNMTTFEVMFFNKAIMKNSGIKQDPYQLWKAGKWNWDTCLDIALQVQNKSNNKIKGITNTGQFYWMLSAGEDFVKSTKAGLKNNVNSAGFLNAWNWSWKMVYDKKIIDTSYTAEKPFYQGKAAMFGCGSYMMQADPSRTNYVPQNMKDPWGVVPFPSPEGKTYASCEGTVWGFPTGVTGDKLQAAAWYLRYYLDDYHYSDRDFYPSDECWEVMKWMWDQPIQSYNSVGVLTYGGEYADTGAAAYAIPYSLIDNADTPTELEANLQSWEGTLSKNIEEINSGTHSSGSSTVDCWNGKHQYTGNCGPCEYCGAARTNPSGTTGHDYKKIITKATTSENGVIKNVCSVCGYTASKTTTIYKASSIKLSKTSYTYNGKVQKPSVVIKDSSGKTVSSSYYTVKYASDCKNAGTYKVTVTFKGNYSGTKTLTYKINPISVSKCEIALSKTSYTYDGKSKIPGVIVLNHKGTKLTDSSYTVTYASGRKNVGKYKVTIKMKGNYSGTKTLTFKINPAKTTVKSLTAGKKSLKVAITKKSTQVTGYEVQYSTSKSFKSYKSKWLTSYKKTSLTITGLSAKKTYYVRVRTYKKVGGVTYYSGWSTIKYKKTK